MIKSLFTLIPFLFISACGGAKQATLDPAKVKRFTENMTGNWLPDHCRVNAVNRESYLDYLTLDIGSHFIYRWTTYKSLTCTNDASPVTHAVEGYYKIMSMAGDTQSSVYWEGSGRTGLIEGDVVNMQTITTLNNLQNPRVQGSFGLRFQQLTVIQNGLEYQVPGDKLAKYQDIEMHHQ